MTHEEQMAAAKKLGARVAALRAEVGITQAELARRTGINRPNIARIENGRYGSIPHTLTIMRLALGLRREPSEIFGVLDGAAPDAARRSELFEAAMCGAFAALEAAGVVGVPSCSSCGEDFEEDPDEDRCPSCGAEYCMTTHYTDERLQEGDLAERGIAMMERSHAPSPSESPDL